MALNRCLRVVRQPSERSLEESFGEDFFSQDVIERVKTYLDACHELGREPLDEKKLLELGLTEHDIAYQKLAIVTEALIRFTFVRVRLRVAGLAFV